MAEGVETSKARDDQRGAQVSISDFAQQSPVLFPDTKKYIYF